MDNWQEHLDKLDRREKLAKKVACLFVLCLLLGFGLWSVVNIWPRKPKPEFPQAIYYDRTDAKVILDAPSSKIDSAADAIQITSSAGGIEIITGTSSDAIEIDASVDGIEIVGISFSDAIEIDSPYDLTDASNGDIGIDAPSLYERYSHQREGGKWKE